MPRHALHVTRHFQLPGVINAFHVREQGRVGVALRQVGANDATCFLYANGSHAWQNGPAIAAKYHLSTLVVANEAHFIQIVDTMRAKILT